MSKHCQETARWIFSHVAVSTLKAEQKLRRHPRQQLERMTRSIREFGIPVPIVVDSNNEVINGHLVLKAAKKLGLAEVPVARLDDLTEPQARALRIALNRLSELGAWDEDALTLELADLGKLSIDVELTGFSIAEIDAKFLSDTEPEDTANLPVIEGSPITRPGDIWSIGKHIVACGDSRDLEFVASVLGGEKAQMVFTDPPYNVPIDGYAAGIQQSRYREFEMAAGEMTPDQYREFLKQSLSAMMASVAPGAILFVCIDWRHLQVLLEVGDALELELKNVCVWAKTNFGMGSFYRSQTEHVVVFKVPGADHIRNFGPGTKGRNRTNLWTYPGANGFGRGRAEALEMHPTVKPIALVADAIRDCSKRKGIILDLFAGAGSTLLAADRTGRIGCGIEIDPRYVDTIVRQLEKETGERAIREDHVTFAEASAQAAEAGASS